jgi:hypothetical protein
MAAQAQRSPDAAFVARSTFEPHQQPRPRPDILEDAQCRAVLGNRKVNATVLVEVGYGASALLAIDLDSALGTGDGAKIPLPIASQDEAATGIQS